MLEEARDVIKKVGKVKSFTNLSLKNLKEFNEAIKAVKEFEESTSRYAETIFCEKFLASAKNGRINYQKKTLNIIKNYLIG